MPDADLTPGEWKVVEATPSRVTTPDGEIAVRWSSSDGMADQKAVKAARLVSAAPNLLAMVAEALPFFKVMALDLRKDGPIPDIIADMEKALKKALGT